MTCKDCVHYEVCKYFEENYDIELYEDQAFECLKFKPKFNFVEVVRCKDCKYYNTNGCADGFGWCEEVDCGKMDYFYCSYAEKALKERESE